MTSHIEVVGGENLVMVCYQLILMILNKDLMQRIKCEWKMCRCMISLKNKVFSHIEFMIHQLNTSGMKALRAFEKH